MVIHSMISIVDDNFNNWLSYTICTNKYDKALAKESHHKSKSKFIALGLN